VRESATGSTLRFYAAHPSASSRAATAVNDAQRTPDVLLVSETFNRSLGKTHQGTEVGAEFAEKIDAGGRVVPIALRECTHGNADGLGTSETAKASGKLGIGEQGVVARGSDLVEVRLLAAALMRDYGIRSKVSQSLAVAAHEAGDSAHQVEERQGVDRTEQIAQGDLRQLQTQTLQRHSRTIA
jgi:hypothetical protein